MTASQTYSIEEKDRIENLVSGEEHSPPLRKQIEDVVLDLFVHVGSLETVGELMIEAQIKQDTSCAGFIINQYTELIYERLGCIEVILASDIREGAE